MKAKGAAFYLRFLGLEELHGVIPDGGGVGYSEHGGVAVEQGKREALAAEQRGVLELSRLVDEPAVRHVPHR